MLLAQEKVEKSLLRKGFKKEEGDHHYFIYWDLAGKKTIAKTKTSHSGKDLDDTLLGLMAHQVKLSRPQFSKLVACPLSREEYEEILRTQGHLPN